MIRKIKPYTIYNAAHQSGAVILLAFC